ncbi:MAG TPA: lysophospholipid acyltransferase family protein [Candidatus Polarisedimenticolia bacterium]|jgi:KDO2-lipid IV(A) lauroyltransferase|nr:lysophospholipid acyltransferase family protein [Candidatus Polarisedimenticolia bacterium]
MTSDGVPAPAEDRGARPGRWYTHGWNRDLSWRLIHAIIPRVPRVLRPPIHLVTTLICFAAMSRERSAVRRNLERVTGRTGPGSMLQAFRLFYNFSKFMVGYTDLMRLSPEELRLRIECGEELTRRFMALLSEGRGLIVLTLHLGNWEVGLAHVAGLGPPVNVVLRQEDSEAAPFEAEARARAGVRVVSAGESAWNGLDLLLSLRRGEIVAIQGDRPFGPQTERIDLFGAPVDLPAGPFVLAQASGAPILAVSVPIRGHSRYLIALEGPLRVGPGPEGVRAAMEAFARMIERFVGAWPTQWFNFYEVWGGPRADGPEGRR